MLLESTSTPTTDRASFAQYVDRVLDVLKERRGSASKRRPPLVSIINSQSLERFLHSGLIGRYDLKPDVVRTRRLWARREVERLIEVFRKQPIGTQIGIVDNFAPEQTFQVFEKSDTTFVTLSPYRLGDHPNISAGIAMVTAAPEAVRMFKTIITDQWERALKGAEGARFLEKIVSRTK
jgi:hypothetical protein